MHWSIFYVLPEKAVVYLTSNSQVILSHLSILSLNLSGSNLLTSEIIAHWTNYVAARYNKLGSWLFVLNQFLATKAIRHTYLWVLPAWQLEQYAFTFSCYIWNVQSMMAFCSIYEGASSYRDSLICIHLLEYTLNSSLSIGYNGTWI